METSKSKSLVETSRNQISCCLCHKNSGLDQENAPINWPSVWHQVSSFTTILSASTKYKFMQFLTFTSQCGCRHWLSSRRSRQEQLKMTRINFAILISHVVVVIAVHLNLRFIKSTFFHEVKQKKWKYLYSLYILIYTYADKMTINRQHIGRQFY